MHPTRIYSPCNPNPDLKPNRKLQSYALQALTVKIQHSSSTVALTLERHAVIGHIHLSHSSTLKNEMQQYKSNPAPCLRVPCDACLRVPCDACLRVPCDARTTLRKHQAAFEGTQAIDVDRLRLRLRLEFRFRLRPSRTLKL